VFLLDHLIRPPEPLRGLEIDDQLELRRLLDGKIGRLLPD